MKATSPEWFKKSSVYQINPRTFTPEGTVRSIIGHLPLLADLGFKIIYLCPIFEEDDSEDRRNWSKRQIASNTENPKNPYRMNDYFKIDSEYGSADDLRDLVSAVHGLGMKLLLDLVYFHIGPNAPIIKAHPEFIKRDGGGGTVLGWWNFPVLNYESEGLREYLYCNMVYYIGEIGVDGFRCDVGDTVPLDFWREGKRRIQAINPEAVMINEGSNAEYLTVFDATYGFSWHNCMYDLLNKTVTAEEMARQHKELAQLLPSGGLVLRDMDNHDTVTDWPYRIEEHFGSQCMELILTANYMIDGIPMVYCGNELADTARLNMFANRFYRGAFEVTDRGAVSPAAERRKSIMKNLNAIRSEWQALYDGRTEWLDATGEQILAFRRASESESIIFIGNFSAHDAEVTVGADVEDEALLSSGATRNGGKLKLSKYGYAVFREH